MNSDGVKRLRQLEQENARLKKLWAERDLEVEIMKEINAKKWRAPPPSALQAEQTKGRGLSEREACALTRTA